MESPGPGHGHRGFLVQRNHESGGIVIAMILPLGAALQQRVEATSCNRDFFTILNPACGLREMSTGRIENCKKVTVARCCFYALLECRA